MLFRSVFAHIEGYDKEGMVHVSEVAGRWVRDIREFVKENQVIVCRVMRVEGNHISLSIKRVSREEGKSRLNEFKREKKSEKMLEFAAKQAGIKLDKAYDEVGYELIDKFGSLTKAFDIADKNTEMLLKQGVKKEWAKLLTDIAEKTRGEKSYELKAELTLTSYRPDGADAIKAALAKLPAGYEAHYISAPKYIISVKGNDRKAMEAGLTKTAAAIVDGIKKNDGAASFKVLNE